MENVTGIAKVIEGVQSYQVLIHSLLANTLSDTYRLQAKEYLESQLYSVQILGNRASSNDKRLENEISLVISTNHTRCYECREEIMLIIYRHSIS